MKFKLTTDICPSCCGILPTKTKKVRSAKQKTENVSISTILN